jgi:DNA topoisomerase I
MRTNALFVSDPNLKKRAREMKPVRAVVPSRLPRPLEKRLHWWRRRGGKKRGFRIEDSQGNPITDTGERDRIQALAIPPAWKEVRIAPSARSNLQAIGLDTSGRVQYLYRARFVAAQQKKKFEKLLRFGERLPALRAATSEHIAYDGLPEERVLAVMLRLISDFHFRLGTEQSVRGHRTYGITTLRNRHLRVLPKGKVEFQFVGKHHVRWRRLLADKELAALLLEIKAIGGSRLFHYLDEANRPCPVTSAHINRYIKQWMGAEFSAKDFRTWAGTLRAAATLAELGGANDEQTLKRHVRLTACRVAEYLGNTPTVCKTAYIHPLVFDCYRRGIVLSDYRSQAESILRRFQPYYEPDEAALVEMLRKEAQR